MKILDHRALRGPNYYSRHQAIHMRLDIGVLDERPSSDVPKIGERLRAILPDIHDHRCSIGAPGGFLQRVEMGTYAGHMVEHVAIELQNMIGFQVGYGKTVNSYDVGVYNVVYRYRDEACGLAAGIEAVEIVDCLYNRRDVEMGPVIDRLKEIRDANMLGPSTGSIVAAAAARNIPHYLLTEGTSYIQLGHGIRQKRFQATMTDRTGLIGSSIANDKDWTKQILGEAGVPVPQGSCAIPSRKLWQRPNTSAGRSSPSRWLATTGAASPPPSPTRRNCARAMTRPTHVIPRSSSRAISWARITACW